MPPLWNSSGQHLGNASANGRGTAGQQGRFQNQSRSQFQSQGQPMHGSNQWHAARQGYISQLVGQHGGQIGGHAMPQMMPQGMGMPSALPQMNAMPQGVSTMPPMMPQQGASAMPPAGTLPQGVPQIGTLPQTANQQNNMPQSLPDGVQMFPASEENMRQLYSLGANPPPAPDAASISSTSPAPTMAGLSTASPAPLPSTPPADSRAAKLRELIQGEQNGAAFYHHLSVRAPRAAYSKILTQLSLGCAGRQKILDTLRQSTDSGTFTPTVNDADNTMGFYNSIRFAILEESRMLRDLSDLYDQTNDAAAAKQINSQMARKINDVQLLQYMLG